MTNYNKVIREPMGEKVTLKPTDVGNLDVELASGPDMTTQLGSGTPTDPFTFEPVPNKLPTEGDQTATVVCPSHLNVRESADILSRVVAILKPGDIVEVQDIQDDWTHVYTSSGIEGYSLSEYIVPTSAE